MRRFVSQRAQQTIGVAVCAFHQGGGGGYNQGGGYGGRGRDQGYGNQGGRNQGYGGGNQGGQGNYGNQGYGSGNQGNYGNQGGRMQGGRGDQGYGNRQQQQQGNYGRDQNRGNFGGGGGGGRDQGYGGGRDQGYGNQGNRGRGRGGNDRGGRGGSEMSRGRGGPVREPKPLPPLANPSEASNIVARLQELKKSYKKVVHPAQKRKILHDGVELARTAQIDPLEPNEKTVALMLNAAAFFELIQQTPIVGQCVSWMRENAGKIEPQNLALFAHAIASLEIYNRREILEGEIAPRLRNGLIQEMMPVELAMILQALERSRVKNVDDICVAILERLTGASDELLKAQTLSTVLFHTSKLMRISEAVAAVVPALLEKVMPILIEQTPKTHSSDVLTLLHAFVKLQPNDAQKALMRPVIEALLGRMNDMMRFYTTEDIPRVFFILQRLPGVSGDLDLKPFMDAANERLKSVAHRINFDEAAKLCKTALELDFVPPALAQEVANGLAQSTNYAEPHLGAAAKCLTLFARAGIRQDELTRNLVLGLVMETPSKVKDEMGESKMRIRPIGRSFYHAVRLRKAAEGMIDPRQFEPLGVQLPERLLSAVGFANERQLARTVALLCEGDGRNPNCINNRGNDKDLLVRIANRIDQQGQEFWANVKDIKTLTWLNEALEETQAVENRDILQFLRSQAQAGLKMQTEAREMARMNRSQRPPM